MKKADVGVAAYVLAAFIMMIVPIPNWLLDVLLACNIAIAFTILFVLHIFMDQQIINVFKRGVGYVLLSHHAFVHHHI